MLLMIIGAEIVVAIRLLTARFKMKYIPVIRNFLYLNSEYKDKFVNIILTS